MNTKPENIAQAIDTPVETKKTTMEKLTEGEVFPEVQQHAVEAFKQKTEAENKAIAAAPVKLKKDGTPAAKRGRKPAGEKAALNDPRKVETKPLDPTAPIMVDSTQAATTISGIIEQMQVTLISDEFIYSDIERANNIAAWRATCDFYGGVSLSPPMALALSHASIVISRAGKPKTKTKLGLIKAFARDKFANLKAKLDSKKQNAFLAKEETPENVTHADNRSNAKRENNVRNKESGGSKTE